MSGIEGVGGRVRFTSEEDETTKAIVERDTKVAINGNDKTWSQVKGHQQGAIESLWNGRGSLEHTVTEITEMSEAAEGGAEGAIAGSVLGLWLGIHELIEAHAKGDEQNVALRKDYAHVAVLGSVDLPACYKAKRFEKDFAHVSRATNSEAFKMTEKLAADTKGRALLQLHADRGMHAAKDLMLSKTTVESFLKANSKVAQQYQKDAAFREGFDAYVFTKANGSAREVAAMEAGLVKRDAWYAADNVSIRV